MSCVLYMFICMFMYLCFCCIFVSMRVCACVCVYVNTCITYYRTILWNFSTRVSNSKVRLFHLTRSFQFETRYSTNQRSQTRLYLNSKQTRICDLNYSLLYYRTNVKKIKVLITLFMEQIANCY